MKTITTFCVLILVLCADCFGKPMENVIRRKTKSRCGYQSCKKVNSSMLNVHMVPHSHDDVGWQIPVNQYYYGAVQYIIGSIVEALKENPERKFIQVETAFFNKWWSFQNDAMKQTVRQLVNDGQLEIIGGAWSMNDEAATHYHSTIDQFTLGLGMINETFGECGRPKIGWQIDPFGHSREQASLFAQMGYDAFFFGRLDYREKRIRLGTKSAEMVWRCSANLGETAEIFTGILYNLYFAPSGFCFDVYCGDEPIIDDAGSPEYNYENKVESFADFIREQARYYQTNNIIITMGGDFQYQDAFMYFLNMDKLITGFKEFPQEYDGKLINLFYSTPSCYAKAVNDEAVASNIDFPIKTDDFFPYASGPDAYWAGFFTSRPTSKRFERQGNNLLQVAKQLSTLNANNASNLQPLKEAMGIMQHHDAITGTEKQQVANDYHRILSKAMMETNEVTSDIISNLLRKYEDYPVKLNLKSCLLANVSYCPESTKNQFIVTVYNPLSRKVSHYVQLPVNSTEFTIIGPDDKSVEYQVTVSPRSFKYTELDTVPYTLIFYIPSIPPFGLQVYYITNKDSEMSTIEEDTSDQKFVLGDATLGVQIDDATGKLKSMTIDSIQIQVEQNLMYYYGSIVYPQSGAYIFRPSSNHTESIQIANLVGTSTYKGKLLDEIHQMYGVWATQVIRVYKNLPYVEFDWIIGPIDKMEEGGKEVISQFTTNVNSNYTFYTDSNGREMLKRVRNYRPTYNYTNEEPVSGNYYPVTSKIVIKDDEIEFAVLNDRAQGGSSLNSGEIELMIHRRCLEDDQFGVGESLQEMEYNQGIVVRGQHYVTFGSISGSGKSRAAVERNIAQQKILAPWIFVAEAVDRDTLKKLINFEHAGLTTSLPENVQILTLEPRNDNKILLRLEHILEANEDPVLSKSVIVTLQGLFTDFEILSLRETTLAGNQWFEQNERLKWILGDVLSDPVQNSISPDENLVNKQVNDKSQLQVTLNPMQIRTFVADVKYIL